MSSRKRARTAAPEEPTSNIRSSLLSWLESCGAEGLDRLRLAEDPSSGGIGAFARRNINKGEVIASIPQRCVLSTRAAENSDLGKAVRAAAVRFGPQSAMLCTDEVLLWICMAVGRVQNSHPWHAYLASLPEQSPDPACWPLQLRAELNGTPVGASVQAALDVVNAVYDGFAWRLREELPELVPEGALDSVLPLMWARGMMRSRSFPACLLTSTGGAALQPYPEEPEAEADTIAGTSETWGHTAGVLLPLLDTLNHRPSARILWVADEDTVRFVSDELVLSGSQVFNNYGNRPNEELLFSYGFSLHANPADATTLILARKQEGSLAGALERRGFRIRRPANGGVPLELLKMLAEGARSQGDPEGESSGARRSLGEEEEGEGEVAAGEENDEECEEETPVEIGAEELELLLRTLRHRLSPLETSRSEDDVFNAAHDVACTGDMRRAYVAYYRQGLRDILESAIEWTESLLGRAEGEEGDCEENE